MCENLYRMKKIWWIMNHNLHMLMEEDLAENSRWWQTIKLRDVQHGFVHALYHSK